MAWPGSLLRPACERREVAAREAGDIPTRRPARLAFRTCLAVAPRRIVLEGEIGNHAYLKVTVAPPSPRCGTDGYVMRLLRFLLVKRLRMGPVEATLGPLLIASAGPGREECLLRLFRGRVT